jgi:ligand-binding sensor domain-containing protein
LYDERTGVWDSFSDRDSDSDGIHHHGDALLPLQIAHICQSKDGIMWFSDGSFSQKLLAAGKDRLFLTSFDGKEWRSFPFAATSNSSIGLIQGTDGRVWSWAMDELRYWERGRWSEPTRISDVLNDPAPQLPTSLAGTSKGQEILERYRTRYEILGAMQDREGYLWLTTDSGVFTYNPRTSEFRRYPALRDVRADPIYEDHQGRIWFNDLYAATMYDRSKGTVTSYDPLDHTVRHEPDDYSMIVGICQDRRGRMIFACAEGLVILNEVENRWSFAATKGLGLDAELVRNTLVGIMEDSHERIWLSGFTGIAILAQ